LIKTLYITRNGLLEPLGQSQVFSYLRGLSQDYNITLITYEKPEDWSDDSLVAEVRAACEKYGIRWLPQKFHSKPRLIASTASIIQIIFLMFREICTRNVKLVHTRSYIPAAAALFVYKFVRVPFIFDMRALWPEELITAGRLKRGSILHLALIELERRCLRDAAAVVSLTNAAKYYLADQYENEIREKDITIIPTCTDLERFKCSPNKSRSRIYGCIGTVLSGWFKLDWLSSFYLHIADSDISAEFEIITRDNEDVIRDLLDPNGILGNRLSVYPLPPDSVPGAIQSHYASVMFYAGGETSELGRSPTRMGEILGCGLPVIANEGVGDVAEIIYRYKVGIIVKGNSDKEMKVAYDELELLKKDPGLPSRCRNAAEEVFSLESGTRAYSDLYANILHY
jgi:glycosyltransferase involved in cell wall biosynthesis